MLDEASFDFSSSLTSELRFPPPGLACLSLQPYRLMRLISLLIFLLFLLLTRGISNHSACSAGNIEERAFSGPCSAIHADGRPSNPMEGQSLEIVLVLRSDDPPWAVSRVGIIESAERSDSPPPAPRAAAAAAATSRVEVLCGAASMMMTA